MRRRVLISSSSDEEELSKKKKVKSKSKKRYSSSDSEDESRFPRKRSKSKKLASKRKKKDLKKSENKRRKNSKRFSSSDCSSSDSDNPSSPVRKSKKRKRGKERGRKRVRVSGSKRKRHKSSSLSCSTSSEIKRTSDSKQHFESSPSKEKIVGKSQNGEQIESSHKQSPFNDRLEANYDDKIESSDGQSLLFYRYGICYRQSPIKDRYGSNFVQSSIEESFDSRYLNNPNEMGNRRPRSIAVVKSLDEGTDKISEICDENPSSRDDEIYKEGNKSSNLEMKLKENEKVADDLELVLRQKALENLKKFRSTRTVKVESQNDKKDEMSKGEDLDQSLQIAENTLESKSSSLVVDRSTELKDCSVFKSSSSIIDQSTELKDSSVFKSSSSIIDQSTELEGSSVVNFSRNRIFKNAVNNISNDGAHSGIFSEDASNTLKTLQESSKSKEGQNERTVTQNVTSKVNETEESTVPSSVAQYTEVPKAVSQSASGSQFEQKTFSRMRDGETVEVKYKVYIPKKTPALARRKLQR